MMPCPPDTSWELLLSDSLPAAEQHELEDHLARCADCQQRLERLTNDPAAAHWRQLQIEGKLVPRLPFSPQATTRLAPGKAPANPAPEGDARPRAHGQADVEALQDTPTNGHARQPVAADAWPEMPGYEIEGELGRGGMGVVYRARQKNLKRTVALKMLLAGTCAGREQLDRFRAEAEAVARLQHPNIIQVHEIGEHNGMPFLCLEFVAGASLASRTAGKPQAPRDAAALIETLARTMHFVHQHGIVHRDLKPANILLAFSRDAESSERGAPAALRSEDSASRLNGAVAKITDFGLAKLLDGAGGAASAGLTRSGTVLGTPSYMAPEQARSVAREIGPATDIYALGVILYELLTGRPPFGAATTFDTLLQVTQQEPVAPRQLQPNLPRDLETICLKCLRKEAGKRYATALALAEDLQRFLESKPIRARPVGSLERAVKGARRHPRTACLLAVVTLLLAVGIGLVLWQWQLAETRALGEKQAKEQEQQARREVERASAGVILDQGINQCDRGDIAHGLLSFVRGPGIGDRSRGRRSGTGGPDQPGRLAPALHQPARRLSAPALGPGRVLQSR